MAAEHQSNSLVRCSRCFGVVAFVVAAVLAADVHKHLAEVVERLADSERHDSIDLVRSILEVDELLA